MTLLPLSLFAQKDYRSAVFAEALGSGGLYSVNFERTIKSRALLRAGFSTFSQEYWFPLMVGTYFGKGNGHLEVSAGASYVMGFTGYHVRLEEEWVATGFIGYRYHRPRGRFLFRVGYTPLYEDKDDWIHWGGISAGWRL